RVTTGARPKLILVCSTPNGRAVYRGVVFQQLPDFGGPWTGEKVQNRQRYREFFDMGQVAPNLYVLTNGVGGGYVFNKDFNSPDSVIESVCMVSAQKKIGFSIVEYRANAPTNGVLRATMGRFVNTPNTTSARTRGV